MDSLSPAMIKNNNHVCQSEDRHQNPRSCVDCRTTTTPLWRGGPAGPRSLCNACGIRYRKKMGVVVNNNNNNESCRKNKKKTGSSSSSNSLKMRVVDAFRREMVLQRPAGAIMAERKRSSDFGEEERGAAMLLMALSLGGYKLKEFAEPDNAKANYQTNREDLGKPEAEHGPFTSPKHEYVSSPSPRLERTAVGQSSNPMTQQKRSHATLIDDVSCIGFDGTPCTDGKEDRQADRKEQEEDDRDYFKHRKASSLSEVELADTRKPITQATDGTAVSGEYGAGGDVIGWLPEQLDTADEAFRRATEIWKQNAVRGDPDAPHSKVLRTLRGEWF